MNQCNKAHCKCMNLDKKCPNHHYSDCKTGAQYEQLNTEEWVKEFDKEFPVVHNYCDDCWYTCPKHPSGCCDESQGDECNCGADTQNVRLKQFISKAVSKERETLRERFDAIGETGYFSVELMKMMEKALFTEPKTINEKNKSGV